MIRSVPTPKHKDFEIGPSAFAHRAWSWFGYVLFYGAIAGAFVYLFVLLTASWRVAIGAVVLLVGYMTIMAWWAERNADGREDATR